MRYKVYGAVIDSDISFWQLPKEDKEGPCDYEIRICELPAEVKEHIREHAGPSGRGDGFYWFNTPGGHFVIWHGKAILTEESSPERLEKMCAYLLGYGLSMLFQESGKIAIHCSAVADPHGCILLSGFSGAGKSTLASRFLEQGWKLMADDVAIAGLSDQEVVTAPAYPVRKLCRDAALRNGHDLDSLIYVDEDKDKYAVACPDDFAKGPAKVRGMFVITPREGGQAGLEELKGDEKIGVFMENLFLRVIYKNEGMRPECFFRCMEMLGKLPVYRLYRPKDGKDSSAELRDLILHLLANG